MRGTRRPRRGGRHKLGIAPNLLARNFKVGKPDAVRLADVSYVPTDDGWLYLAAVKDTATMEVVCWKMSDQSKCSLAIDAMRMAPQNRSPAPSLIYSPDRAVRYTLTMADLRVRPGRVNGRNR